ncbi:MAG TPA: O-antigen ligase family protein [Bacteroidia bacterium]|nr:O-antigen ligase family protein [Bacteroidia bacterium]
MLFPPQVHRFFFLFGLISMGFGVMMGAVPTSVPQFVLLINWLLEGGFQVKWNMLRKNKVFWATELLFLIHVAGLLYTDNLSHGIDDLQIKLPLMVLPLVLFSTRPAEDWAYRGVLYAFLTGCFLNTAWCLIYSFGFHPDEPIRNISRFMSHIRLGLYLNMAIAVCYMFWTESKSRRWSIAWLMLALYFFAVMCFMGLASGLIILTLMLLVGLLLALLRMKWPYKVSVLVLVGALLYFGVGFVKDVYREQIVPVEGGANTFRAVNEKGSLYVHYDSLGKKENGYYIQRNIQLDEVRKTWNARCPEDSFSFSPAFHNTHRFELLIRYLASKGLIKDSAAVASLSSEDIDNIKRNIPNYKYNNWTYMRRRLYELVNEYDDFSAGRNVNGNSVTMRYYFWKAAIQAIADRPVFGAGTGDVQAQMNKAYAECASPLLPGWWKHPHNQFLTLAVALGISGLLLFLFGLFYPAMHLHKKLNVLYACFALVCTSSFITEDTIETQAGATFFAFFNTVLLSWAFFKKPHNPEDSQKSH